ncbi:MAG: PilZ domain-containing protein [Bradymonadia bacterium]
MRRVVIEIENESYQVSDISLGGCFIDGASNKWPPGKVLKATLVMPFNEQIRRVMVKMQIVRVADNGLGAQFRLPTSSTVMYIRHYLNSSWDESFAS